MKALISNAPIRAASFFTLALVLTSIGGLVIGDLRTGIRWGLGLAVVVGVFAYFFIKPTESGTTEAATRE